MGDIINPKNSVLKRGYHRMTLDFGNTYSNGSFHKGCDFTGNTSVDDGYDYVIAIADGVVSSCQNAINGVVKDTGTAGMGNYVYIEHDNGYRSRYQHMKKGSVTVKKGNKVKAGQVIGYIGNTGNSTGRHLHFDISTTGKVAGGTYVASQNRTYFDPKPYIKGTKTLTAKKSVSEIAKDIINGVGEWENCNGTARKTKLEKMGYNYNEVQAEVNRQLKANTKYYPKYEGDSNQIDVVLKAIHAPSQYYGSWLKRKPVAKANGISAYIGSSSQNLKLVNLARQGKLVKP